MIIYASTSFISPTPSSVEEAIDILQSLTLDGIEIGSTHQFAANFAQIVQSKLKLPALVHNYCPPAPVDLIINLASTNEEIRIASLNHALSCLEFASLIGASLYTVHPGFMAEPQTAIRQENSQSAYDFQFAAQRTPLALAFAQMRKSLETLLIRANELGIDLAVESEGSLTHPGILLLETPAEYQALQADFGWDLGVNFNLAHSWFAAQRHGFTLGDLIIQLDGQIRAVEISHNQGHKDEHKPLQKNGHLLPFIDLLPNVPLILEFRDANQQDIANSIEILKEIGF